MSTVTIEDYATFGRIHGASLARVHCGDFIRPTSAEIEAANKARCDCILAYADQLMASGVGFDEAQAFATAADNQFFATFQEMCLALRMAAEPNLLPELGPKLNRQQRRALKSKRPN